jgi:putative transferase (TIGR04331 family)
MLCGEWLMHFSHVTYAAYIDAIRGETVTTNQTSLFVFSDFHDYQSTVVDNPSFSHQLRQQVTALLGRSMTGHLKFQRESISFGRHDAGIVRALKSSIRKISKTVLGNSNAPVLFCQPYVKCSPAEWALTLIKWRSWARHDDLEYPIRVFAMVDAKWRAWNSAEISVNSYFELVCSLIPQYIPTLYLEAFSAYRHAALSLRLPRPQVTYTATGMHGHSLFKVLAADWRESGTSIVNHQHGGGYGIDRLHASEDYESRISDRFYTMGWSEHFSKQKPLATPLSAALFKRAKVGKGILLTCVHYPKQVYRIHFQPMPGTIENTLVDTTAFVHASRGWCGLKVRAFAKDYGWRLVDILRKANPAITFDDMNIPGVQSYGRFEIVVHSYLGTAWLETMAMDIPTVCFYDPQTYAFRDAVQPYIHRFEHSGLLHRNGASAATFVESIKGNPQDWWRAKEVQDLRREFISSYANFSKDWAPSWEKELVTWI